MTAPEQQRWSRIEALLEALEDMPSELREAELKRLCPDPELQLEVRRLLDTLPDSSGYLARVFDGIVPERAPSGDLAGRHIGAYRLLKLIGRGGMGVVYEAERDDETFAQRVALKLLTTPLLGTETHDRFLAERRILATLEHPAIARIFDGGVAEDGTPWFAMEHVEGEPITDFCDRHRLDIRSRLALFLQVCDAVEHAHQRLVVHRDLKPANVLVASQARPTTSAPPTADPGPHYGRQVKLLDFGIAKLLDADNHAAAPPTRTALRLMTPEYASPEQVRGGPITTASDVYQLGLLLYRLLAGSRPYTVKRRSPSDLERAICEQPPTRLSAAVTLDDKLDPSSGHEQPTTSTICALRRSTPAKLRRQLRGDLENIVGKALSKEPERRYTSADRLAQDIRRYLTGLPVTARADTWFYRGRKFLGRHAVGASITAATLLLVLSLTGGMIGFHLTRIQDERDLAQLEAAKAQQVSEFLVGLFRSADPLESGGADITVRQALDRGLERVDRELTSQPEVQADMLRALGRTYTELGLYDAAGELLGRALEYYRGHSERRYPDASRTIADLGVLAFRKGEFESARDQLRYAAETMEAALGPDSPDLASILRILGPAYHRTGEHEEGLASLERAVSIETAISGEDSETVANSLNNMGVMLSEMGDLERSEALQRRSLAIRERELGADHPSVGINLVNLASVQMLRGRPEDVETLLRRGLEILRDAYGPDHGFVGLTLTNLGGFLLQSGRTGEAIAALEEAVTAMRASLGPDNPELAMPALTLALAHRADGNLESAREQFRRTLELRSNEEVTSRFDPLYARALIGLAGVEADLGNSTAAAPLFEHALSHIDRSDGWTSPLLEEPLYQLGHWLAAHGRCAEARPLLNEVVRIRDAQEQPLHAVTANAREVLNACAG